MKGEQQEATVLAVGRLRADRHLQRETARAREVAWLSRRSDENRDRAAARDLAERQTPAALMGLR